MAVVNTVRAGLKTYTAGTDPHPSRTDHNAERTLLDSIMALADQGLLSARPAAGTGRKFYWTTDAGAQRLYWDDGTTWQEVSTNGGGGAGGAIVPGAAGVEGTATRSARADHTHPLALATASVNGGMAATDKAKLDNAVSAATASRLVQRDAAGRAQFADPAAAADVATKNYVDTILATGAPATHTHDASQIITGTLAAARLPAVTQTVNGAMLFADKVALDNATAAATANQLVERDAAGRAKFADPSVAADVATKGYTDAQVATRAATSHTHAWADITSGIPSTFTPAAHTHAAGDVTSGTFAAARLPLVTTATDGAMLATDKVKLDNAVSTATASRLAIRDATGKLQVATPTLTADAATKGYVDTGLAGKSDTSHTHTFGSITSKPTYYDTQWSQILAGKPSWIGASKPSYTATEIATSASNVQADIDYVNGRATTAINGLAGKLDSSYWGLFFFDNGAGSIAMRAGNNASAVASNVGGFVEVTGALKCVDAYNRNVAYSGAWRAMYIHDDGFIGVTTSSARYKDNIRDTDVTPEQAYQLRPVDYERKGSDQKEAGFIAEEVADAGLDGFVYLDDEGRPDGVAYERLVVAQQVAIRDLNERLRAIEGR